MRQILVIWILFSLLISVSLFSNETEVFSPYRGFSPEAEVQFARNENTKLFRTDMGTFVWAIFLHPVHKRDKNGAMVDIDNPEMKPFWNPIQGYSGTADDLSEYVYTTWMHVNDVYFCLPFAQFNTSGIPDGATIDTVKLTLHCRANVLGLGDHDIASMESRPSSSSYHTIYVDAANGDYYISNFSPWQDTWYTWILGDEPTDPACVRMKNLLPEDWFAIGMCDWGSGFWSYTIEYYSSGGNIEIPEPTAVNLVSFTASPDIDHVMLRWRTEYEVDNLEWIIERKGEYEEYTVIGTLPGQFTKPTPTEYSFTDRSVYPGEKYYYRLIDVSMHGYQSAHNPLSVQIPTCIGEQLLISPTIFSDELTMHIRGAYGKSGVLSILDEAGRVVKEISISGRNSPLAITWNGMDSSGRRLSNGVYFIRLAINGNKSETKRVIFIR